MSAACITNIRQFLLCYSPIAIVAGGTAVQAQTPPLRAETIDNNTSPAGPSNSSAAGPTASPPAGSPATETQGPPTDTRANSLSGGLLAGPDFRLNANVLFSESYLTNAGGVSGANQQDYMSTLGFNSDLHEHSRRLTLDANYNLVTDFYARGTVPTQISNYLQALGNVDVIPEYFDLSLRAFAQPLVTSNFGALGEGGREVPGAFENSYGYFATPELKFKWGDVATFKTTPSYGQVFFTTPPGTTAANVIPGLATAQDTTLRSLTEEIASGPDFGRLDWKLIGFFSETAETRSLLSEKSGIGKASYALSYEFSLLVTAGYDSILDTQPLTHNVSGPEALAGLGLTFGRDFSLEAEAGERYNSLSFDGNLHWDITPTSVLTASANDFVQTPEGQLLNNLTSLTALPNGTLTAANDVLENGTASTLSPFSVQSLSSPALNQFVFRYQTALVSFAEEFERTHLSFSLFGTRQTYLTAGFTGPPTSDSWGVQLLASRNLNPLLTATLGGSYIYNQELGGQASTFGADGELDYSLSRATHVFLRNRGLYRKTVLRVPGDTVPIGREPDRLQDHFGINPRPLKMTLHRW